MSQNINPNNIESLLQALLDELDHSAPSADVIKDAVSQAVDDDFTSCPFCNTPDCTNTILIRAEIERRAKHYQDTRTIAEEAVVNVVYSDTFEAQFRQMFNAALNAREKAKWERSFWAKTYRSFVWSLTVLHNSLVFLGKLLLIFAVIAAAVTFWYVTLAVIAIWYLYCWNRWEKIHDAIEQQVTKSKAKFGDNLPDTAFRSLVMSDLYFNHRFIYEVYKTGTWMHHYVNQISLKLAPITNTVSAVAQNFDPRRAWLNGNLDAQIKRAQAFFAGLWQRLSAINRSGANKDTK